MPFVDEMAAAGYQPISGQPTQSGVPANSPAQTGGPFQDEMAAAGYKPLNQSPAPQAIQPKQASLGNDSPSMNTYTGINQITSGANLLPQNNQRLQTVSDYLTGHNTEVEKWTGLPMLNAMSKATDALFGTHTQDAVSSYEDKVMNQLAAAQQRSPTATSLGETSGIMTLSAPFGELGGLGIAKPFMRNVASNSAAAGVGSAINAKDKGADLSQSLVSGGEGALLGGALTGGLAAGGKAIVGVVKLGQTVNRLKNAGILFKKPDDFVNDIMAQTAQKAGGSMADANPVTFQALFQKTLDNLWEEKTRLYNIRDEIANSTNAVVNKNNLAAAVKSLSEESPTGLTSAMNEALKEGTNILGQPVNKQPDVLNKALGAINNVNSNTQQEFAPVSFKKADDMLNELRTKAYSLYQTDPTTSRQLDLLGNAFEKDINKAVEGNAPLQKAHDTAVSFYRDKYAPLNDLANRAKIQDEFTNHAFVDSLIRNAGKNPIYQKGFNNLSPEMQMNARLAFVDALKRSKTLNGELDAKKFSDALQRNLNQFPYLKGVGDDFSTLTKALQLHNYLKQVNPFSKTGIALDATVTKGGITAIRAASSVPYLLKAAQMLKDPEIAELLRKTTQAEQNGVPPNVQQALYKRIASEFGKKSYNTAPKLGAIGAMKAFSGPYYQYSGSQDGNNG
jgi:hypothetical protein